MIDLDACKSKVLRKSLRKKGTSLLVIVAAVFIYLFLIGLVMIENYD